MGLDLSSAFGLESILYSRHIWRGVRRKSRRRRAGDLALDGERREEGQAETLPSLALGKEEAVARALGKEMAQSQAHEHEGEDEDAGDDEEEE